jgi:hypothetical protein
MSDRLENLTAASNLTETADKQNLPSKIYR